MRAIGYWLIGMGFLSLGHLLDRLVIGLVPEKDHWLDPPMWAISLLAASFVVHWFVGKGVMAGRPAARFAAIALIAGWITASLVGLNTESLDPPHDGERQGHALAALGGVMLGARWPTMPSHAGDFLWTPSGVWGVPEFVAVGVTLALGLWMIGLLWVTATPTSDGSTPDPVDLRRRIAAIRADASRPASVRVLGAAVALHLSLNAVLIVASLIGLSYRVAGKPF